MDFIRIISHGIPTCNTEALIKFNKQIDVDIRRHILAKICNKMPKPSEGRRFPIFRTFTVEVSGTASTNLNQPLKGQLLHIHCWAIRPLVTLAPSPVQAYSGRRSPTSPPTGDEAIRQRSCERGTLQTTPTFEKALAHQTHG